MDMSEEILLMGGRSTEGVVRIGDTVRRPHQKSSEFSNNVLVFFDSKGFECCPKYLGCDKINRDIYRYIDGTVPAEIGDTTLNQLVSFMKIVKKLHDTSTDFTQNNNKVICHNDLSPCNTVFRNNEPIAIIDWDSAAVCERWEDLAYILWLWINIGSHRRENIDILPQMKKALVAYGADIETKRNFADKMLWRMDKVIIDMQINNPQYKRTKDWVEFSKLWVQQNTQKIRKYIG